MSSHLLTVSLVAVTIFSTSAGLDLCPEPDIPNGGTVNSKKAENFFLGEVICTNKQLAHLLSTLFGVPLTQRHL